MLDAVLDVFGWAGFGAAAAFGLALIVLWAGDGTWLRADGFVDRESDGTWVRWFDHDGVANSAQVDAHTAGELAGRDRVEMWYRRGWEGRMRLTRRPPLFRLLVGLAIGFFAVGIVSVIASWILLFARG